MTADLRTDVHADVHADLDRGVRESSQTWCEIDRAALSDNARALKRHLPPEALLAPAVKSNAYGHGLLESARALIAGGADWLCVHTTSEARALRESNISTPIYVFGPTLDHALLELMELRVDVVLYDRAQVEALIAIAEAQPDLAKRLGVHLKIETGNHRQGVGVDEALALVEMMRSDSGVSQIRLVGITSHFANIEDTRDHSFARLQLSRIRQAHTLIEARWGKPLMCHMANSAASLLWPEHVTSLARVGIASYGLWPSEEVRERVSPHLKPALRPALSWRARIAQVKEVAEGQPIGYGCTYVTTRPSRIAILPVGYYEGYDRGLSNRGAVLIKGELAPIRGRICMNMCMVDVTELSEVSRGDIATLIGSDGEREVSADDLARWSDTINYEVVSRIAAHVPRVIV